MIQKTEHILDSVSEVFLLFVVILLVALPFAVAANLNPINRPVENLITADNLNTNVLGASSVLPIIKPTPIIKNNNVDFNLIETTNTNMEVRNSDRTYTTATAKLNFKKSSTEYIYNVTNNSDSSVNVTINLDTLNKTNLNGFLIMIDSESYGYNKFSSITVKPGQSFKVGISAPSKIGVYPMDYTLSLGIK